MKKNRVLKFAALVLVLTLVTSSLVSGTYAKYTSAFSGTGTVTVAQWHAKFNGTAAASGDIKFNLFEGYTDTGVAGELLAPGTSGSFSLGYDTSDSQVARHVEIKMDATSLNELEYLSFYTLEGTTKVALAKNGTLLSKNFSAIDDGEGTITVYWEWPFENEPSGIVNDAADTVDGIAAKNFNITVNFTATQLD